MSIFFHFLVLWWSHNLAFTDLAFPILPMDKVTSQGHPGAQIPVILYFKTNLKNSYFSMGQPQAHGKTTWQCSESRRASRICKS